MAETQTSDQQQQQDEPRKDAQGVEIDMSSNIPAEQEGWENVELDQTAKHNDLGEGHHKNSVTFGIVTSHYAPDAAGTTPQDIHERAERRMGHSEEEIKAKEERAEASVQRMEERKASTATSTQEPPTGLTQEEQQQEEQQQSSK